MVSGVALFKTGGKASLEGELLPSLPTSSDSPLLYNGETLRTTLRIRLRFVGMAKAEPRFLFAFSRATVGAGPFP